MTRPGGDGPMTRMWTAVALVVFAYLAGSIASAIVVSRLMGLPDPRTEGSGNPGATNVLRLGGRKAAALTLAGDYLKGLLPVLVAAAFGASPAVRIATGLAAFMGHLYPLYFRFQGGKGVATALGLGTGLGWPLGLAMGATWLVVARLSRFSSLASLSMAVAAPIYAVALGAPRAVVGGLALMSLLLVWRHRANIARLVSGNESRIGAKRAEGGQTTPPE